MLQINNTRSTTAVQMRMKMLTTKFQVENMASVKVSRKVIIHSKMMFKH
jgi:hypothetical protein